jgi:uncharacterized repeat protein (TIGR03803 family)
VIADAQGNLFGTTVLGGKYGGGTVFEIPKTLLGYATTPTILFNFDGTNGANNPYGGLILDGNGNLFGTTAGTLCCAIQTASVSGTVFEIQKTFSGYATAPTILYRFCAKAGCADGAEPLGSLIADLYGNLFGTTLIGGPNNRGTVFEIAKTASGYATTPTILHGFSADDGYPSAGLIVDSQGNLFGTTLVGGPLDGVSRPYGTVFEIAKTASGYAAADTILVTFDGKNGALPVADLFADAKGNLLGTTFGLPQNVATNLGYGTVFEIVGSDFHPKFSAIPGPNCVFQSLKTLYTTYGNLIAAAFELGYPDVGALLTAIQQYCALQRSGGAASRENPAKPTPRPPTLWPRPWPQGSSWLSARAAGAGGARYTG